MKNGKMSAGATPARRPGKFNGGGGDEDRFDSWMDWMSQWEEWMKSEGRSTSPCVFSISDVDDMDAAPYPDAMELTYDGGWGAACSERIPVGATWLDLWEAAGKLIARSGDGHHVFLESVDVEPGTDGKILGISTGS